MTTDDGFQHRHLRGVGHVVLYVADLKRSLSFYRDLLGWPVVDQPRRIPPAILRAGNTHHDLLLIEVGTNAAPVPAAARAVLDTGLDSSGSISEALAELEKANTASDHLDDVVRAYDLSGDLLSRCIEVALPAAGHVRDAVLSVLETRLAHEVEIRGDFSLAGRT